MKTQTDISAAHRLIITQLITQTFRPFKVADTPFHIHASNLSYITNI